MLAAEVAGHHVVATFAIIARLAALVRERSGSAQAAVVGAAVEHRTSAVLRTVSITAAAITFSVALIVAARTVGAAAGAGSAILDATRATKEREEDDREE